VEITRRGSTYNYGKRTVSLNSPRVSCDKSQASVTIESNNVKDFTGESHHDYTAVLNSDELVEILNALATSAMGDPKKFESILSPALRSLIQLSHIASGTVKSP